MSFALHSFDTLFSLTIDWLTNGMNSQTKLPGVKSVLSKISGGKADHFVDHGDKIYFGNLFLEVNHIVLSYFTMCCFVHLLYINYLCLYLLASDGLQS